MATFNSTEYAAQHGTPGDRGDVRDGGAKVRRMPFNWVVPASPGAAPVIQLCKLPAGAKHPKVYLETDGLSSSGGIGLLIDVGDSGDVDRLVAAFDADVAAKTEGVALAGSGYEYTTATIITATVNAGKTPVAGQKIWGYVDYLVD